MNTLTTYTEAQLLEMPTSQIVTINNSFASACNLNLTHRFANKAKAVARCLTNQAAYVKANPAKEEKPAKATPKSKFDTTQVLGMTGTVEIEKAAKGTIQRSIFEAIKTYGCNEDDIPNNTIEDIIFEVKRSHKRPRSEQVVDEAYVIHNIKWFIKKGSLEIVK